MCFCMSEVISSFRSLGARSHVFAYVISLCDFAYVFGLELAIWYVVLVCHQYDVCENYVGSVYGGLSEIGLCVFCKLCPVCFLVVGKCPSILL